MNFDVKYIFSTISGLLVIVSVLPYLIDILKGKTKPSVVSWLIWTLLTGISCSAAIVGRQYFTAILLGTSCVSTLTIALIGWKKGDKNVAMLDKICFVIALLGIVIWRMFNLPEAAIIINIMLDFTACIPTLVHSWLDPYEETWVTFFVSAIASFLTVLSVDKWSVLGMAFPAYLTIINLILALGILGRRRFVPNNIKEGF